MSEMVERVARALCLEYSGIDWDDEVYFPHKDQPGTYTRPFFRRLAVVAIAALREPTEGMNDVGWRRIGCSGNDDRVLEADAVWRVMIDEALK